jgi:hypothetical protein
MGQLHCILIEQGLMMAREAAPPDLGAGQVLVVLQHPAGIHVFVLPVAVEVDYLPAVGVEVRHVGQLVFFPEGLSVDVAGLVDQRDHVAVDAHAQELFVFYQVVQAVAAQGGLLGDVQAQAG